MLPNTPPLAIAEQFGTLATGIHGDRIESGPLAVRPAVDQACSMQRRGLQRGDRFPEDVAELIGFIWETPLPVHASWAHS